MLPSLPNSNFVSLRRTVFIYRRDEHGRRRRAQVEAPGRSTHADSQAGSLSKAAKELVSSGIHDLTPAVSEKLEQLHPHANLPNISASDDLPRIDCESSDIFRALRSFPVATCNAGL